MVECEICLEEYQEGHLELHRETCVLRLVFRCSICTEDYVSREGLWNHLDQHEVVDESKDLHCQELKAKHKLHRCTLCNDQRCYSESAYLVHVQNSHGNCEVGDRALSSDSSVLADDANFPKGKHMVSDVRQLRRKEVKKSRYVQDIQLIEHTDVSSKSKTDNVNIDKESALATGESTRRKDSNSRIACDNCGKTFSFKSSLHRHKTQRLCHSYLKYPCLTCGKGFNCKRDSMTHIMMCKQLMWLCDLCGVTFARIKSVTRHNKLTHPYNGSSNTIQLVQKQKRNSFLSGKNTEDEITVQAPNEIVQAPVDVLNPQSDAVRNDEPMTSEMREEEANGSRKEQAILTKPSQSFSCPICGITLYSYYQMRYHRLTQHTDAKFQCLYCSRKFHKKSQFEMHAADCGTVKHTCGFCGRKFHLISTLERHKKNIHRVDILPQNAPIDGVGRISPMRTAQEINTCSICRITFDNTDELAKHKLTYPEHFDDSNDSQSSASADAQSNSTILVQDDNIKLEITVEETKLQEQGYPVSSGEQQNLIVTSQHQYGSDVGDETAAAFEDGIRVKEETLDSQDEIGIDHQEAVEFSECQIDRNTKCSICGLSFSTRKKLWYHKTVSHSEPQYECSLCQKKFHLSTHLRYHSKGCSELRCHKCNIKFYNRVRLDNHNNEKHPHDGKLRDDEDSPEDGPEAENVDKHRSAPKCSELSSKRNMRHNNRSLIKTQKEGVIAENNSYP